MTTTTKFRPSHRGSSPSVAEELEARAREVESRGTPVISLHVGQPSTGAPAGTLETIEAASRDSTLGYTPAAGVDALRKRLAQQYAELDGVEIDPERIIVTLGASGAMILAIVGCFDERQRVGLPQPFYYGYRHAMETHGVECVHFPTSMDNDFQPTIAHIQQKNIPPAGHRREWRRSPEVSRQGRRLLPDLADCRTSQKQGGTLASPIGEVLWHGAHLRIWSIPPEFSQ